MCSLCAFHNIAVYALLLLNDIPQSYPGEILTLQTWHPYSNGSFNSGTRSNFVLFKYEVTLPFKENIIESFKDLKLRKVI